MLVVSQTSVSDVGGKVNSLKDYLHLLDSDQCVMQTKLGPTFQNLDQFQENSQFLKLDRINLCFATVYSLLCRLDYLIMVDLTTHVYSNIF